MTEKTHAGASPVDCRVSPLADALDSLCRQLAERAADDADTPLLLTVARATALVNALDTVRSASPDEMQRAWRFAQQLERQSEGAQHD